MPKYRVENSRDDVLPTTSEFDAVNDETAQKHFEKEYKNNPVYEWDYLILRRIDVIEKTTNLETSFPNERRRK